MEETLKITKITTKFLTLTYSQFSALLKAKCDAIEEADIRSLWNKTRTDEAFATTYVLRRDHDDEFFRNGLRFQNIEECVLDDEDYEMDDCVDDVMNDLRDYHNVEQWDNVYYEGVFGGFCGEHPHLQDFKVATYYQTFGGGPEGGFLVMPDGDVYTTQRTWGEPFDLPKKLEGKKLLRKKMDGNWMCRLVDA